MALSIANNGVPTIASSSYPSQTRPSNASQGAIAGQHTAAVSTAIPTTPVATGSKAAQERPRTTAQAQPATAK